MQLVRDAVNGTHQPTETVRHARKQELVGVSTIRRNAPYFGHGEHPREHVDDLVRCDGGLPETVLNFCDLLSPNRVVRWDAVVREASAKGSTNARFDASDGCTLGGPSMS